MKTRTYALLESSVMGRLPVLVLSFFLAVSGVGQLINYPSSHAIGEAGGMALDVTWSVCLILAFIVVLYARLAHEPGDAVVLEVSGIILIDLGIITYAWALYHTEPPGITGRLFIFSLMVASFLNASGRGVLLIRRALLVRRFRRGKV